MTQGKWSPLRGELRRTRLKPVSDKKRRQMKAYAESVAVIVQRSGGHCEADTFSPYCSGVGTEAHHIVRRSQGGTDDPSNLAWICSFCHRRVHEYPDAARLRGLLKFSWER